MGTIQKEKKKLNGTSEQTDNKELNLIEYVEIDDTPFTVVGEYKDEVGRYQWYIMMGKYRLTEDIGGRQKAIDEAKVITWEKIMGLIGVMVEEYNAKNKK